jgi:hypothetical protein
MISMLKILSEDSLGEAGENTINKPQFFRQKFVILELPSTKQMLPTPLISAASM